jgi:hypothetical protein
LISRPELGEPRVWAQAGTPATVSTTSIPLNDRHLMLASHDGHSGPAQRPLCIVLRPNRGPTPLPACIGRMLAPPGKRHYTFRRCRRSGSLAHRRRCVINPMQDVD